MSKTPFRKACVGTVMHCPDPYAKAYARAGLGLDENDQEAIQTQCLYILNNMPNWRGPVSRECREVFKALAKPPKRRRK